MTGQMPTSSSTIVGIYYLVVLTTLNPTTKNAITVEADTCNVLSETYNPNADILLGFIGSKRLSSTEGACDMNDASQDQVYEAAKILVDNLPTSVRLPNVSIGLELYDVCGTPSLATSATLQYASSSYDRCTSGQLKPGVIGPTTDSRVPEVNTILRSVNIPLISPAAANRLPRNTESSTSENILRTLPSNMYQAEVMVDLTEYFGWSYITLIATRGDYGERGAEETRRLATERGICASKTTLLDDNETSSVSYDDVVTELVANPDARGIVLWCSASNIIGLLDAIERHAGETLNLVLLTSDSANTNVTILDTYPKAARGLISIRPFDSTNTAAFDYLRQYSSTTFDNLYAIPVLEALLAYSHALAEIHQEKCGGMAGLCEAMGTLSPQEMAEALLSIRFPGIGGEEFAFDSNGEPSSFTLEIMQYQNDTSGVEVEGEAFHLQQIGVWKKPTSGLVLTDIFEHYSQDGLLDSAPSSLCGNLCSSCTTVTPTSPSKLRPPNREDDDDDDEGGYKNRGDHYMRIPGDLDIPSILSLSEPGWYGNYDGLRCGYINEKGVLSAEALLYALDKVNADPDVFPGINLGVTIMDSCKQSVIATRQLAGVLGQTANLEVSGPTMGILGPDTDNVAEKVVQEITAPAGLVTISYGNNPSAIQSPNFFQTSPSLDKQVRAIAEILAKLDWYYAGVVYSSSTYGKTGYDAFRAVAKDYGICLGPVKEIKANAVQPDFDVIFTELYNSEDMNVIVTFVSERDARRLLVTQHLLGFDRFSWVGTETWTADPELFLGFETQTHGSLIVAPAAGDLTELEEYLSAVDLQDAHARNPWLEHALEKLFPCDNTTGQPQRQRMESNEEQDCVDLGPSGLGTLVTLGEFNSDIFHIINAFYALAYGADRLRQEKCANASEVVCQEFFDTFRSEALYDAVASVTFDNSGQEFNFIDKAGPGEFVVHNYQMIGANLTIVEIGLWSANNLTIDLDSASLGSSVAGVPQRDPLRCSLCFEDFDIGREPTEILEWELEGIWVTIILAVSAVCLFLVFCTICAFIFNYDHPVVTSTSLSLSLWLLLGLAMMYCMNLAYLVHANTTICAIRRVGTALSYAVTYSALSVKSIRVNRLVRAKAGDSMSFSGNWSQTLLFCVFLAAQFFITAAWLLLQRPNANAIPGAVVRCQGEENLWTCDYTHLELVVSLSYVYALVLFTFISSIGAVKYPYYLNEGKFLHMISICSIAILSAWACVYTLADQDIAIPALVIGSTADATIILAAMFMPKCGYIGEPLKSEAILKLKPMISGLVNEHDETTDF